VAMGRPLRRGQFRWIVLILNQVRSLALAWTLMKVLFLCTANSCRSQMAEGMLSAAGGSVVEVASAGSALKPVHPDAVIVMREIGIDISGHESKAVSRFQGESFDYVITLCAPARDACPAFAGAARRLHWEIPDPTISNRSSGEQLQAFRRVRGELS